MEISLYVKNVNVLACYLLTFGFLFLENMYSVYIQNDKFVNSQLFQRYPILG